jgi:hypothetical protein
MNWKQYQEEAADLLRAIGFTATVEAQVDGARSVHKIDVYATHTAYGFKTTWIVECKYWNRAVPKEKVLVLSQIAADIGADRALLLSESGFQSGAILATQNTNVILSSLADFRESVQPVLRQIALTQIAQRAYELEKKLQLMLEPRELRRSGGRGGEIVDLLGRVFALKTVALPKVQAGDFPVRLFESDLTYSDHETFISAAAFELGAISNGIESVREVPVDAVSRIPPLLKSLEESIGEFLDAAEIAVSANSAMEHDNYCRKAVPTMRRIGDEANELDIVLCREGRKALRTVMQALIDGPYLLVTQWRVDSAIWRESRTRVSDCVGNLRRVVQ